MAKINIKINNIPLEVEEGMTILQAAKLIQVDIPHLCYHPDQSVRGHCRVCSVEVVGGRKLMPACATKVWEGMEVFTNTKKVYDTQKLLLEMILANHKQECLTCQRNGNCELQNLSKRFNLTSPKLPNVVEKLPVENNATCIVRDLSKCVKCGRCAKACREFQGIEAISYTGRSSHFKVMSAFGENLEKTDCILCGQCTAACPVGALVEKDDTDKVYEALQDPTKHVIVQVAPAVRVALGDAFGMEKASIVTSKMVTALRRLGFDQVFDTNFAADVTIMEEGTELLDRVQNGGTLPMITSCSPGWINFMEKHYPDQLAHLSTTKSPQQIFGALSKTYYPKVSGIDAKDIVTVSIMPCTAKKYEAARPEMGRDGMKDVDIVLTTRELSRMIATAGFDFAELPDDDFDAPMGIGTGAGAIFGATGGVMEAALRTVYEVATGKELAKVEFNDVRGYEGIKESEVDLNGTKVRIAVAHGLKNARVIMDAVRAGKCDYTFIEIMAC
ncbi:MAG: (2Fe-2S)-binding protein, partial [Selenomonadales bacterium]|nr:(2Fe-2S)-binding protein [Selenomonadales bacterium]